VIYIFHPQAETLHQAQAAAIEKARQQQVRAGKMGQYLLHLRFGEYGRQTFGFLGADGFEVEGIEVLMQHLAIEEEESGKGLVLGGGSNVVFGRQVREKGTNFGGPHFAGMAFVVEEDKASNPIDIGFFCAQSVVFNAQQFADLVKQLGRL
jgi:hypothetical protein